jgi:hypothetical protein
MSCGESESQQIQGSGWQKDDLGRGETSYTQVRTCVECLRCRRSTLQAQGLLRTSSVLRWLLAYGAKPDTAMVVRNAAFEDRTLELES